MEEKEKASTTVDIEKELLLKFKSICVLKEVTMSDIIEELVRGWVAKNDSGEEKPPEPKEPAAEPKETVEEEEKKLPPAPEPTKPAESPKEGDVSDELEKETEKDA